MRHFVRTFLTPQFFQEEDDFWNLTEKKTPTPARPTPSPERPMTTSSEREESVSNGSGSGSATPSRGGESPSGFQSTIGTGRPASSRKPGLGAGRLGASRSKAQAAAGVVVIFRILCICTIRALRRREGILFWRLTMLCACFFRMMSTHLHAVLASCVLTRRIHDRVSVLVCFCARVRVYICVFSADTDACLRVFSLHSVS